MIFSLPTLKKEPQSRCKHSTERNAELMNSEYIGSDGLSRSLREKSDSSDSKADGEREKGNGKSVEESRMRKSEEKEGQGDDKVDRGESFGGKPV